MSPRVSRPSKRHLIRWNEALDKKLLLCIQVACNQDGTKIPWDRVGELMDDNNTGGAITDGAIVQHLAKLRQRMVNENLPVPPPLRRGGTARISTTSNASSRSARSTVAVPPVTSDNAARRQPVAAQYNTPDTLFSARTPSKISKNKSKSKKSHKSMSDEDLDSDEEEFDDDSDGEYGRPITRRAKASGQGKGKGKGQLNVLKIEQSGEEEAISESSNSSANRERDTTKANTFESGKAIHDEFDKEDGRKTVSVNGERYVGHNASFLPVESVTSSRSGSYTEESLMVSLKWGKAFRGESASYQMAHMKLIDMGVLPQLPAEVYSDEEEEEEEEEEQDISLMENEGNYHVDAAGNNLDDFNIVGHSNALTTNGLPHLSNDHPADCLSISHDDYLQSDFIANLQHNHLGLPSNLDAEQHGHFDQPSFENIVQIPVDMEFPQAAHAFNIHTNLDSNMLDFDDGGVALHNPSQTHYAYSTFHMPTNNHGHSHTRYLSDTTNNQSGQSMSSTGSSATGFPNNTAASHHNEPLFGAFPSINGNENDLLDHNASSFDAALEDPNLKLEGFAFGPNGSE